MVIVPSGNSRIVQSQLAKIGPESLPNKRDTVQQEDIPAGGDSYNPIGKLDQTLQQNQQQPAAAPPVDQNANNGDVAGKIGPNEQSSSPAKTEGDGTQIGSDLRDAWYKIMEELGVPPRIFRHPQHVDKFFHVDEEVIGKGEAHGFFILPSRTQQKSISKEEAVQIARKLGAQFGVTNMNFSYASENNYKFSFKILVQDNSNMSGSSLDSMISGGKGSAKAAYSKNSIIKESKNSIIDSLIKQGFGGNHAS